jgi:sugar/nucleoside kinase (ribokinase family)
MTTPLLVVGAVNVDLVIAALERLDRARRLSNGSFKSRRPEGRERRRCSRPGRRRHPVLHAGDMGRAALAELRAEGVDATDLTSLRR